MAWTDPATLSQSFDTSDIPTEANFDSLFNDLLAIHHPLAIETADRDVANTLSELSLWSTTAGGVTVPANAMGANGSVTMLLAGDSLHNNGINDAVTIRVKFGGVTIYQDLSPMGDLIGPSRQAWLFRFRISNRGATNAQFMFGFSAMPKADQGVPAVGLGQLEIRNLAVVPFCSSAPHAIDTTADQSVDVTAQWSVASVNNSLRKRWAQIVLGQN